MYGFSDARSVERNGSSRLGGGITTSYANCEVEKMKKASWIYRLLKWLGLIETRELDRKQYAEMCKRSIAAGICPGDCDRCAWGGISGE